MAYDTRAFGDFGWLFVNAGEQYRRLKDVTEAEQLMMLGIFKQATMGDCEVEAAKGNLPVCILENKQRDAWLTHKGMDTFEAMQLYIEKVKQLAQVYPEAIEPEAEKE